jgi:hypothetical protein
MNAENNLAMAVEPTATFERSATEESNLFYTSAAYHRILDYRIPEILLTTIVFGVILFIRLHH